MILKLNNENFKDQITKDFVLVDFYADWCGPCKALSPIIEEVVQENNLDLVKVNVNEHEDLAREYQVMSIPRVMIFKKGELYTSHTGFMNKTQLEEFIKE